MSIDNEMNTEFYCKEFLKEHVSLVNDIYKVMKQDEDISKYINSMMEEEQDSFIRNSIDMLDGIIKSHDESKFSYDEFNVIKSYLFDNDINCKERYDYMNNQHKLRYPHHWEYWNGRAATRYMQPHCVIEMACDYIAHNGNNTYNNYQNHKDEIKLGDSQRIWFEYLIGKYDYY